MKNNIYYAYVSNPTREYPYSQRLQRLLVQDFSRRKNLNVTSFLAEIPNAGIYYNIEQKLVEKVNITGFVVYSLEMLFPLSKGEAMLTKGIEAGYEFWFAVEELCIKSIDDFEYPRFLENVFSISRENEQNLDRFYGILDN